MLKRDVQDELSFLADAYPVVTITGPRQSGKTTLARNHFEHYSYCNMEHPETRDLAMNDPNEFFDLYKPPVVIDEIQRVPTLLSYIQILVDESNLKGQFILTGSQQLALNESITQSLAGRTAFLQLLPFSINELTQVREYGLHDREELIFKGGFPRVWSEEMEPTRYYRNYFQSYVERDVRQILNIRDMYRFEQYVRILAGRVGQVLNLNSVANEIGVPSKTLKDWLSVLEETYVIYRLPPYYENFGKRLIKSPKLYFSDTGLLCYLLGIEKPDQLVRDPLFGNIFENLVVLDALKNRYNQGKDPNIFFFRDNNRQEVDLVLKRGRELVPIEIKSSKTWNNDFLKGIKYFHRSVPSAYKGHVIYCGDLKPDYKLASVVHFSEIREIFK